LVLQLNLYKFTYKDDVIKMYTMTIRHELMDVIIHIDELTKDDIVEKLKSIVLDKDSNIQKSFEDQIIAQAVRSNSCCMPSICTKNCNDCDIDINAQVDVSAV